MENDLKHAEVRTIELFESENKKETKSGIELSGSLSRARHMSVSTKNERNEHEYFLTQNFCCGFSKEC